MTEVCPWCRRTGGGRSATVVGMVLLIAICEIGFWVLLAAGLAVRYLLRWKRTSAVLLIATPLLDVVLLIATMFDLSRGAEATTVHGLAATYLGFSVAFGHSTIRWVDARVHHWFAGGPPPPKVPKHGPVRIRHELREWAKCLLAVAIACAVMLFLIFIVASPSTTHALWAPSGWIPRLGVVLGIWFVVGPVLSWGASLGRSDSARTG
jgi:hypothetical protein